MRIRFDSSRCIGCRGCELACSAVHVDEFNPARSRIRVQVDAVEGRCEINICRSCGKPRCVEACTYGACTRDKELGTIKIDNSMCVACYACVEACPFGADFVDPVEHTPLVCDGCGGDPACVRYCPSGALTVGKPAPT
jgi:carbon-monoxide dehydrogenase iron sulfur subunit